MNSKSAARLCLIALASRWELVFFHYLEFYEVLDFPLNGELSNFTQLVVTQIINVEVVTFIVTIIVIVIAGLSRALLVELLHSSSH